MPIISDEILSTAPPGKVYVVYQKTTGKLTSYGSAEPDPAKLPGGYESKLVDAPPARFIWNTGARVFDAQAPLVNPAAVLIAKANWNAQDSYDALKLILKTLYPG